MKQSECDNLVKATLENCACEFNGGIWVILLSKELITVIDCGLETLKKNVEEE